MSSRTLSMFKVKEIQEALSALGQSDMLTAVEQRISEKQKPGCVSLIRVLAGEKFSVVMVYAHCKEPGTCEVMADIAVCDNLVTAMRIKDKIEDKVRKTTEELGYEVPDQATWKRE
jgi:hypothetical protein